MHKLSANITILSKLLLSEEGLRWKPNLLLFLDFANNENRVGVIAPQNFIELDVVRFNLWARGVPSHNAFFRVDSAHHVEHLLVVNVIEEPNVRFLRVFFERNCIAISYI